MPEPIVVAYAGNDQISILPKLANRHGLIAGATGTGKTVTLQSLAQSFSQIGVPSFLADVKGDLAGMSQPGGNNKRVCDRLTQFEKLGMSKQPFAACPVTFWDVYGEQGHPVRTTVDDMGPLLLARLLNLNEIQEGVLTIAFRVAKDRSRPLDDYKDLRSIILELADEAKQLTTEYGNISPSSIGAIQRALLALEQQGGDKFFGLPALDLRDFIRVDSNKQGIVNILAADKLLNSPKVYATFLLWMLTKLFEILEEVGDPEEPKFVFFFDEAHLLFDEAPPALLSKIEQIVRLIRSKGVGVYFITQSPTDVPESVLAQLGNRVQHALRAFTPKDQKAVKTAADTFRARKGLDTAKSITELAVGEALISFLEESGTPAEVQKGFVVPPRSRVGPITKQERQALIDGSSMGSKYGKGIDRESQYEIRQHKTEGSNEEQTEEPRAKAGGKSEKPGWAAVLFTSSLALIGRAVNSIVNALVRQFIKRLDKPSPKKRGKGTDD